MRALALALVLLAGCARWTGDEPHVECPAPDAGAIDDASDTALPADAPCACDAGFSCSARDDGREFCVCRDLSCGFAR